MEYPPDPSASPDPDPYGDPFEYGSSDHPLTPRPIGPQPKPFATDPPAAVPPMVPPPPPSSAVPDRPFSGSDDFTVVTHTAPPEPPPRKPRRGLRWVAALVVAAMVLTGVFTLGRLTTPVEPEPEPVDVTLASEPEIAVPAVESPTVTVDNLSALEPVADIAEAVSPAVVQLETDAGLGSGVLYATDGYILTAAHVIADARRINVRLSDGSAVQGEVVGLHDLTDIAVVKIPGTGYPIAELAIGDDIRVGSLAVALGSPFGLDQTVTAGIVSAVDRDINGVSMVQTDAAINPGNSGGPLVDAQGRVIGINDQIFTQSGDNAGIGFAVSIDLAKIVADQLVAGEDVRLSFLGVSTQSSLTEQPGAVVQNVVEGSAAESAGIEVGDIITAVDGRRVAAPGRLRILIISTAPGTTVDIEVVRDGESLTIPATLGQSE